VRVLCRPEVAAGFALAGMRAVPVTTATAADLRLRELVREPDTGVLLVEERLHDALPMDGAPGPAAAADVVPFQARRGRSVPKGPRPTSSSCCGR
jgi:hypothetical protein